MDMEVFEQLQIYAARGIYIEILADCFLMNRPEGTLPSERVAWRPYIHYVENGKWQSEDGGCSYDLAMIMSLAFSFADYIYREVYQGVVPPFPAHDQQ